MGLGNQSQGGNGPDLPVENAGLVDHDLFQVGHALPLQRVHGIVVVDGIDRKIERDQRQFDEQQGDERGLTEFTKNIASERQRFFFGHKEDLHLKQSTRSTIIAQK